jgi:PqqD family protein of HPr-rel-A system
MDWHLTSPGKLYDRNESLLVYFHFASGNTHLISEFAGELLAFLRETPCSSERVCDRFEGRFTDIDAFDRAQVIDDNLQALEAIDLIEQR